MGIIYVSLVGTQVMAVLNPFLAIKEQFRVPDEIHLLGTSFSNEKIKTALAFIEKDPDISGRIRLHKISDSLNTDAIGYPPAHMIVKKIAGQTSPDDEIIFNAAGGLNFQISACIQVLQAANPLYVYPDNDGIHSFKLNQMEVVDHRLSEPPSPVDVLTLQGVKYEQTTTGQSKSNLMALIREMKLDRGRSFAENISIHDVVFELVLNQNNTLHFVKKVASSKEMRKVVAIAVNRDAFGELYHRNIHVLTPDGFAEDRARKEGGGKVRVYKFHGKQEHTLKACLINMLGNVPEKAEIVVPETEIFEGNAKHFNPDTALIMMIGRNILPTLIALWSHNPSHAIFLYTPGDASVKKVRERLVTYKKILPVKTFEFKQVNFLGSDILSVRRPVEKHVWVNISPGTKAHSLFLTQWAMVHQALVYSINTDEQRLKKIPSGEGQKLIGPDPLELLNIRAGNIKDQKENAVQLLSDRKRYETIIKFVRMIMDNNEKFSNFPHKEVQAGQATAAPSKKNSKKTRITLNDGSKPVDIAEGAWVEQLTGFMMVECGAQDVQIRVRTRWDKQNEDYLIKKFGSEKVTHQTDIDVIARFDARYYVIECKTDKKNEPISVTIDKAIAYAGVVGRFAVPIVCFFRYTGAPYKDHGGNGVYIFGCRTLLDKDALNRLLEKAIRERQKTSN